MWQVNEVNRLHFCVFERVFRYIYSMDEICEWVKYEKEPWALPWSHLSDKSRSIRKVKGCRESRQPFSRMVSESTTPSFIMIIATTNPLQWILCYTAILLFVFVDNRFSDQNKMDSQRWCAEKYTSCILPLDSGTNVWYNMIYICQEQTFFTILWEPKGARRVHGSIEMSMSRKYIFDYYSFKSFRFFLAAFSKSFPFYREVSHRQNRTSQRTLWKLCESARKVPLWIDATQYPFRQPNSGFQNRSISRSFHFLGKVCDLDGRHMTVSEKIFSLCHASCSANGRFPEPFTRFL